MTTARKYNLNPVRAVEMKYGGDPGVRLQDISDMCYDIVGAYSGTYDIYALSPYYSEMCENYIEKKRMELYGENHCDRGNPQSRGAQWFQTPAFVPDLIEKHGMKPYEALMKAKQMCMTSIPMLADQCIENNTDLYNAIEMCTDTAENMGTPENTPLLQNQAKMPSARTPVKMSLNKTEKNHPILFWGFLFMVLVVIIFVGRKMLEK